MPLTNAEIKKTLDYETIVHSGLPITLGDFMITNLIGTRPPLELFTSVELYNYKDNKDQIEATRTPFQEYPLTVDDVLINPGTIIKVPLDKRDKKVRPLADNIYIPNSDFTAFLDSNITDIINDIGYKPITMPKTQTAENLSYRINNSVSVWLWSKGLGEQKDKGKLMDITPFVLGVNTNVGKNGGNFSLQLAPVVGEYLSTKEWGLKDKSTIKYSYNGQQNFVHRASVRYPKKDTFVGPKSEGDTDEAEFRRARTLFHSVIKANDLVFIKFETLESEKNLRNKENSELTIEDLFLEEKNLADGFSKGSKQLFDMIGLIDVNSESYTAGAADIGIQLAGRDLMKLLLEDGEYFFPASVYGVNGGVVSDEKDDPSSKRLFGQLDFYEAFTEQTIPNIIKFIIGNLVNVEMVDSDLFTYYGTKRTRDINEVETKGIWQIVKLAFDDELKDRKVVDASLLTDQGNLFSFISGKIVQEPFAEFYGDTWGNQYYFTTRKPPTDQKSYNSLAEIAIDINNSDVYDSNLMFDDSEVYSWYSLEPSAMFFGSSKESILEYLPARFFASYARIWGSRPYSVKHNYLNYQAFTGTNTSVESSQQISQSIQDLAYIIESNAYKPFTRKGTITIRGDRRIKIGTCIRLKGTNEIFYVDSVSNSYSITNETTDRVTVLTVSRGMIEEYILGITEDVFEDGSMIRKNVSYFNIIDLKKDNKGISKSADFKVNKGIFNFFIKGLQFKR